jgi:hypothetical protein
MWEVYRHIPDKYTSVYLPGIQGNAISLIPGGVQARLVPAALALTKPLSCMEIQITMRVS